MALVACVFLLVCLGGCICTTIETIKLKTPPSPVTTTYITYITNSAITNSTVE